MRRGLKIVSYYVVDNEPLMEFSIDRSNIFDMQLLESSFDFKIRCFRCKRDLDDANRLS
jgi:hypothetical protein